MIVHPRSLWTASNPRPVMMPDEFYGLPYYDDPPVGIQFCRPGEETLFVYRNPLNELERLRTRAVQGTGHSDIDYNYAISQNTEGVYVLRGAMTKCIRTDKIRVLLLLGNNEEPTDLLKRNQQQFLEEPISNPFPVAPLSPGDSNVHVFNLIEFLTERGLYTQRNDGIYSPFVEAAISKLQKDLGLEINGRYTMWVINALESLNREYIALPVGAS